MTKKERQSIFEKYGGRCAYCGYKLEKGWHVDHIEPIVRNSKWDREKGRFIQTGTCQKPENDVLSNNNPSCASCNIVKNSLSIEQFREHITRFVHSLNQYSTQYKFAKRYGLIAETNIEVKFYFETFNTTNYMDESTEAAKTGEPKILLASDLINWLKEERNLLQNTGQLMWHKPEEQENTLHVAHCLDKTIQYIELSKITN